MTTAFVDGEAGQIWSLLSTFHKVKLAFLAAAFISFVLSVSLWFSGSKDQGIFVGLWVPSILSFGALLMSRGSDG